MKNIWIFFGQCPINFFTSGNSYLHRLNLLSIITIFMFFQVNSIQNHFFFNISFEIVDSRNSDEPLEDMTSENWSIQLRVELAKDGITLPER